MIPYRPLVAKIIVTFMIIAGLVAILIPLNLVLSIKTELEKAGVGGRVVEAVLTPSYLGGYLLTLSFYAITISFVVGLFSANAMLKPLRQLQRAAEELEHGNLDYRVMVDSQDEFSSLAQAFNTMAARVQSSVIDLEQRVASRTRAIETSAEIGRRLSAVLSQDKLVRAVVEQLQKELGYYHVHIYLFDRENENLVMAGGSGEAGRILLERGHSLPAGKGLVGRAAHLNATVLIPDVSRNPEWLPNPLLPETKSEAAVPIAIQDEVLGVIDVQQDTVNGLSQADADLIASIASQVAVALQNARLFAQARRDAERKARLDAMGQEIQGAKNVEEALKISVRELGRTLGAPRVSVRLKPAALGTGDLPVQPQQDV